MFDPGGNLPAGSARHGQSSSITGRLIGTVPWLLIGGLLYAGLFIKPKPVGSAVVPPSIERRDLLFGVAVPDTSLWLVGNFGKILKSQDGGVTWGGQRSGTEAHLQDIEAWDGQRAVVVGNSATVLVTDDGGATWQPIAVEHSDVTSKLMRVKVAPGGEAWAVGEMGAILHSSDWGRSWKQMRPIEDIGMNDIDISNPDNIWVVGEFGRMFNSRDHGQTWQMSEGEKSSSLTAIEFRDSVHGLAIGLDGAMAATVDGGKHWSKIAPEVTGNRQHLFGVTWNPDRSQWLAVGAKGVWVSADSEMKTFATGKLSARDLSAHAKIAQVGGKLVIAGASPGLWDYSTWESLVGR